MAKELILVARLNIRDHDVNRRIYSPDGVAPTIRTPGGGNHTPKVLISGRPDRMRIKANQAAGYVEANEGDCVKLTFTSTVHTPVMGGGHLRNNHHAPRGDGRYCEEGARMTGQILTAARIGCRSTYGDRDRVLDPAGVAPTVLANWGAKCPPLSGRPQGDRMSDYLRIQNATKLGYLDGYPGDGVVLNLLGRARGRVQTARSPTLRTVEGGGTGVVTMTENNELTIRKLTPRECLRLQGYNDDEIDRLTDAKDTNGKPLFPKTKLYFFAGNSVVVDVFAAILGEIIKDMDTPAVANRGSLDYWMGAGE